MMLRGIRCVLILLAGWAGSFAMADEIRVPFGFQWGESMKRMEDNLSRVQARVLERKSVGGRSAWTIDGIAQPLLQRVVFYFDGDALNEIELQYGDKNWVASQFESFFEQTRRNIDAKYGAGHVIARQKAFESNVLQTLIGYQWSQPGTSLLLFYYTAEKDASSVRLVSLHYKGS